MRLLAVGIGALFMIGCNNSTRVVFAPDEIAIEPASAATSAYSGGHSSGFEMPVTITNRSMQSIYREGCGFVVERSKQSGGWEPVWTQRCPRRPPHMTPLIGLPPGQSVTIDVDTRGSGLGPSTVVDGQYRVRFLLLINRIGGFAPLPTDLSVSTPFKVVNPNPEVLG